ncbi:MAG: UDP-N-acetyl-D-mannosaminuronic acid dehydrogenase, partial [Frankiales bacterium]|nr:UDP-N-acetyl-D-mannosaminuronic acid dehydrogenase [Frankiales bacterium]
MRVAVIGLGKIGLPLAVQVAASGHQVIGADRSQSVVDLVMAASPPFPNEAELDARLASVRAAGSLVATTSTADAVAASEVVLVVVPLVVDASAAPDFAALDAATAQIGPALRPRTLVSYETTLPVHTTRQRFAPALQASSGLELGTELLVCHSPERVFSGRVFADLRRYPKLVGGIDEASAARAVALYESALQFDERPDLSQPNGVWDLGSAEAAELTKLVETTYRDVNIALANEFSAFADEVGLDVRQVIEAANSQPYSHVHQPGIAVGGHCIPVYPRFYSSTDPAARLPVVAREVNEAMPAKAVAALESLLDRPLAGLSVLVLGAAYRGGVKETAFSGVFAVVDELRARGAR